MVLALTSHGSASERKQATSLRGEAEKLLASGDHAGSLDRIGRAMKLIDASA